METSLSVHDVGFKYCFNSVYSEKWKSKTVEEVFNEKNED